MRFPCCVSWVAPELAKFHVMLQLMDVVFAVICLSTMTGNIDFWCILLLFCVHFFYAVPFLFLPKSFLGSTFRYDRRNTLRRFTQEQKDAFDILVVDFLWNLIIRILFMIAESDVTRVPLLLTLFCLVTGIRFMLRLYVLYTLCYPLHVGMGHVLDGRLAPVGTQVLSHLDQPSENVCLETKQDLASVCLTLEPNPHQVVKEQIEHHLLSHLAEICVEYVDESWVSMDVEQVEALRIDFTRTESPRSRSEVHSVQMILRGRTIYMTRNTLLQLAQRLVEHLSCWQWWRERPTSTRRSRVLSTLRKIWNRDRQSRQEEEYLITHGHTPLMSRFLLRTDLFLGDRKHRVPQDGGQHGGQYGGVAHVV